MIDEQKIVEIFRYHAPHGTQNERYEIIRDHGLYMAQLINEKVPDGHEKAVAIDKLREVVMWANAGIACGEIPRTNIGSFRIPDTIPNGPKGGD